MNNRLTQKDKQGNIGRYEDWGAFYAGGKKWGINQYLIVNAWMPLPEPYRRRVE